MNYIDRLISLAEKLQERNGHIPFDLEVQLISYGIIL